MTRPTLVLLPGLLCDDAVWRDQCAALTEVRCVVPDYGTLDSLEAMARHVLDSVPTERFSLAGHSMGGRVALEVARLAPGRIDRIALMDTGVTPLAAGEAAVHERAQRLALLEQARQDGMRAMGCNWARGMVHPSRLGTPLFENILDMIERKTPEIFAAQIHALLNRPDARATLTSLKCPTLLLCGRQDAWSTYARHEDMHRMLPSATLVPIEDSGHMTTMEQPDAVNFALRNWLAQ